MKTFLRRALHQTAVYWPPASVDGYGTLTFGVPRDVACRWEDEYKLVKDAQGKEVNSSANCFVDRVLAAEGWLWLGTASDLTVAQKANPQLVAGARSIISVASVPHLRPGKDPVRRVWLS